MGNFYLQNARWLGVAWLMNFASGFGQTFFIALFAGEIRQEFALSHGDWGAFYAIGTTVSAALMLGVGGIVDRFSAQKMSLIIMLMLAFATLSMALNEIVWLLPMVIFLLRFAGQGMLTHLSMVLVGKWFSRNRGKSVAFATFGFSACEAAFPVIFVAIMLSLGWRASWLVACVISLILMVVMYSLLGKDRTASQVDMTQPLDTGMGGRHWTRGEMLRHWVFWASLVAFMSMPLIGTTVFFQMVHLTEVKGWALDGFVSLVPLYTLASLFSMFAFGYLVDGWGVSRVMRFHLLPMALGLLVLAEGEGLFAASIALALMGFAQGASATVMGAFWPEYYGTKNLGSIRAVAISMMVFSSALGPLFSGLLLDQHVILSVQFWGMAAVSLVACGLFIFVSIGTCGGKKE